MYIVHVHCIIRIHIYLLEFFLFNRYHNEEKQLIAGVFFRKIQEAYQILCNPRLRAIYDMQGKKGVMDEKAIIERTALPIELMEEYGKLKAVFDERTYIQDANPTGLFEMKVDATEIFRNKKKSVFITGVHVQQQVDAKITKFSSASLGGLVYASVGGYSSVAHVCFKQLLDKVNWVKVSTAVGFPTTFGLEFYRQLTNRTYVTSYNYLQVHSGFVVMSLNGRFTYKLNNQTTIVYKAVHNASSVGLEMNRTVSQKLNLSGEIVMGNDSSHVEFSCRYKPRAEYTFNGVLKFSSMGPSVVYGVEHKLATLTNFGATVSLSQSGVDLRLSLTRTTMSFVFKIAICPYPSFYAIAFGTISPALILCGLKLLSYAPILRRQKMHELAELKEERKKEMFERKKQAESVADLMKETAEKISSLEETRQGLVILEAWYGCLFSTSPFDPLAPPKVIDVTVPLQAAVQDSKLVLCSTSKSLVPGFYDPCIGEKKHLRVRYEFHGIAHEVTIENSEPLIIPRQSHKLI